MISNSNYSSASILTIPHLYLDMVGSEGLREITESAIRYAINNPTHFLKVTSLSAFLNILIGSIVYIEFGLRGLALALILNSIVVSIYILTIVNKNTEVDQNKELMFYFLIAILFLIAVIKLNIGFIVVAFMTIIMFTWYLKRLRLDKL